MALSLAVLILVMTIRTSVGQTSDPLIEDFINSIHTSTITPKSCGLQKACVPFYRCRADNSVDSICSYPDTCCDISEKNSLQYEDCGNRNLGSAENETDFYQFPWLAALMTGREAAPENHRCNAVVITSIAVLTNALCVRPPRENLFVQVGEWIRMENKAVQHRAHRVDKIIIHEGYNATSFENNLSLLIVERPFQWEPQVRPVCLPDSKIRLDFARCYAPSWTNDSPYVSGSHAIVKRLDLPIVPKDQCQVILGPQLIPHTELCAGGKFYKDYDTHDSGAPLVCPVPGVKERYFLAGIATLLQQKRDVDNKKYVTPGSPRLYLNVTQLIQWVIDKLTQHGIVLSHSLKL